MRGSGAFNGKKYAIRDGNDVIFSLDLIDSNWDLKEDRIYDLILDSEVLEEKTIIQPPDGWRPQPESLPADQQWIHPAGTVKVEAKINQETQAIEIVQRTEFKRGALRCFRLSGHS